MENFKVAVILVAVMSIVSESSTEITGGIPEELRGECFVDVRMCDKDEHTCIKQLLKYSAVIHSEIAHETVRKYPGPQNFSVSIHPLDRTNFASNFTYSVYRVLNGDRSSEKELLNLPFHSIKECCDIPFTENCTLSPYIENSTFIVVMPLNIKSKSSAWYGFHRISYTENVFYDLCGNQTKSYPCVNLSEDGLFYLEDIFIQLSAGGIPLKADFCFFPAPTEMEKLVKDDNKLTFHNDKYSSSVVEEGNCEVVVADDVRNAKELVPDTIALEGVICYRPRFPPYSYEWSKFTNCFTAEDAKTHNKESKDENSKWDMAYFQIVAASVGCLILLLMFMTCYCCRRYFLKKMDNSLPSTLILAKTAFITEKLSRDIGMSEDDVSIEVYFPMEVSLPDGPDEVSIVDEEVSIEDEEEEDEEETLQTWPTKSPEKIERNGEWSSNDIPKIDESGTYCSKFDMNPYIKVRHEIS